MAIVGENLHMAILFKGVNKTITTASAIVTALMSREWIPLLGPYPTVTRLGALIGVLSGVTFFVWYPCLAPIYYMIVSLSGVTVLLASALFVERLCVRGNDAILKYRILGGFWVRPEIKSQCKDNSLTLEGLIERLKPRPEEVWTKGSRLASQVCVLLALFSLFAGIAALASFVVMQGISPLTKKLPDPANLVRATNEKAQLQSRLNASGPDDDLFFLCTNERNDIRASIETREEYIREFEAYSAMLAKNQCVDSAPGYPRPMPILPDTNTLSARRRTFETAQNQLEVQVHEIQDAIDRLSPVFVSPTSDITYFYLTTVERKRFEDAVAQYRGYLEAARQKESELIADSCTNIKPSVYQFEDLPKPSISLTSSIVRPAASTSGGGLSFDKISIPEASKYQFKGCSLTIQWDDLRDRKTESAIFPISDGNEVKTNYFIGGGDATIDKFNNRQFVVTFFIVSDKDPGAQIARRTIPPGN